MEVPVLFQAEESEPALDLKEVNIDFNNLNSRKDPEKDLFFSMVQLAVEDYLFFGSRNTDLINVEEFFSAYSYLFNVRSAEPNTWLETEGFDGSITNDQLKLMCFDVHYDYASLGEVIKKNVLLDILKNRREKIVEEHYESVIRRMNIIRKEYQVRTQQKIKPSNYNREYIIKTLTEPTESALIKLYYGE